MGAQGCWLFDFSPITSPVTSVPSSVSEETELHSDWGTSNGMVLLGDGWASPEKGEELVTA